MNIIQLVLICCLLGYLNGLDNTTESIHIREEKQINLNKSSQCHVFLYDSSNNHHPHHSDFIIVLFKGNNPTTTIVLSQKDDYAGNNNEEFLFAATSKEIVLPSFERKYSKTINITFCDYSSAFRDYFYVIDETAPIVLKENMPISIHKFSQLNFYSFIFSSRNQTGIKYELQINSLSNTSKGRIQILNEFSSLPMESIEGFNVNKVIELKPQETLLIKVINEEPLLEDNEISVMISEYTLWRVLNEKQTVKRNVIQPSSFLYYINTSHYKENDEGVVSLYLSNEEVIDSNLLRAAYGKIITLDEGMNLLKPIRKEENEFKWNQDDPYELNYRIRFKKTTNSNKTGLLLYFDFIGEWFKPFMFRVSHLKRLRTIAIDKENCKVVLKAKKHLHYYYSILFDSHYIRKSFLIQTIASEQYTLIIESGNEGQKKLSDSIYKGEVPEGKSLLIRYSTVFDQEITFIIAIALRQESVFSIESLNELDVLMKKPTNCFESIYFYQSPSYSFEIDDQSGKKHEELLDLFDFYPIELISSINKNYNEMNIEIHTKRYASIEHLENYQRGVVSVQCKRRQSTVKQSISLKSRDFSIEVNLNEAQNNEKAITYIYLFNTSKPPSNLTMLINTVSPYISLSNKTSHFLYPIKPGQYIVFLVLLTQRNNSIFLTESNEYALIIPTFFPTSIEIFLIMLLLLFILVLFFLAKGRKAKEE